MEAIANVETTREPTVQSLSGTLVEAVYEDGSPAGVALITPRGEEIVLEMDIGAADLADFVYNDVELCGTWRTTEEQDRIFVVTDYELCREIDELDEEDEVDEFDELDESGHDAHE